jgi:hypothetical protein
MWTKQEEKILTNLYPNKFNNEIATIMCKTKSQIDNKGYRLGLIKSKELLDNRNNLGVKGKLAKGGRCLTYDVLKKIASKYKTKIDFIQNDGPAYQAARLKGFLSNICSHMTVIKFSIPQLILREITDKIIKVPSTYNNRKILKPYEIDIFYEDINLGFEFQGIAWHVNNKNDKIKKKLADKKGIKIIYIHEINNSRNYEADIKKQLIDKLKIINNHTKNKITKEDVEECVINNIYKKLYNREELIEVAKSYDSFKDFKEKELAIYKKLNKLKIIDIATNHMKDKKLNKLGYSNEYINSVVQKYDNLTDFRKNELQLYKHIKRVNKDYLIKHLKRK